MIFPLYGAKAGPDENDNNDNEDDDSYHDDDADLFTGDCKSEVTLPILQPHSRHLADSHLRLL